MHDGPCRMVAASVLVALAWVSPAWAVSAEWTAKWREDLAALIEQLETTHPDPWHVTTREEFVGLLEELVARLGELEHHEVVVGLAAAVARLEDGHTRVTLPLEPGGDFFQGHAETPPPAIEGLVFRTYPIRFAVDDEGVWVERVEREHATLLESELHPTPPGEQPDWADDRSVVPLARRNSDRPFWFEWLPDEQVVLFRFNQVGSREGETLAAFTGRLMRFIDEHTVQALIIDMRANHGGWHSTSQPLLHGLIGSKVDRTGGLFALIGRTTFSAASSSPRSGGVTKARI